VKMRLANERAKGWRTAQTTQTRGGKVHESSLRRAGRRA
jgi:hypothetical protein